MRRGIKKLLISFSVIALIFVSIFLINQNIEKNRSIKVKLESIIGSSLFQVWDFYQGMQNYEGLDRNNIEEINNRLQSVQSYSKVIDSGVSTNLLGPIADKMITKINTISSNFNKTGIISVKDQEVFDQMVQDSKRISDLITDIYYETNTHQEGKIKLKITNYEELKKLNEKI
ncbi:hypothetical protein [Paenibacillus sp. NPDC093718]|uniref:hypothetical protein n=1 Tax=Paenibacillus sp. NPDC093718 TaxID=3390601 RepID=UPI003D03EDC5